LSLATHFADWLALLLRWAHFIVGIAWIGASFYFNWLENRLQRQGQSEGIAGELWAVHGGGFYHLRKFALAPPQLPAELHWFKWEAYATWLSGFALLVVVFYANASAMLAGPNLSAPIAITASVASLLASWLVYDGLCRALAGRHDRLLALAVLGWFTLLAWLCGEWFSARAAYMQVGAAIGTVMVANVAHVIIPAQRELVAALSAGRAPDGTRGKAALTRNRHNNYFTLPVLFIMISAHFPGTYGHTQGWLVLLGISLAGVAVRHFFNIRHLGSHAWAWLAAGLGLLLVTALATAPWPERTPVARTAVPLAQVLAITAQRCASCHAVKPSQPGFVVPPMGIALENVDDLQRHRQRIYQSVYTRTMPLANLTGMTDEERQIIVNWALSE
jgi:uncharacterized membrane protein